MHCPKCYGAIDKRTKRCKECGFNMNSIKGATHKEVKQARKDGFGEDVIYTSDLPSDIKKKKLLLLCIFLGLFGAHSYYAGKKFKAIYSTVITTLMLGFAVITFLYNSVANALGIVGNWIWSSCTLLMGFNLVMFVSDLIKIISNKYKVSVYKESFSD